MKSRPKRWQITSQRALYEPINPHLPSNTLHLTTGAHLRQNREPALHLPPSMCYEWECWLNKQGVIHLSAPPLKYRWEPGPHHYIVSSRQGKLCKLEDLLCWPNRFFKKSAGRQVVVRPFHVIRYLSGSVDPQIMTTGRKGWVVWRTWKVTSTSMWRVYIL